MGISLVAILLIINSSSRGQQFVFHYPKTPKRREESDKIKRKIGEYEEFDDAFEEDVVIWPHGNMGDEGDNDHKNNDADQNNMSFKLFGFETEILATILCPKAQSSKFQLSIDDLTFVGQPVFLESTATDKPSTNGILNQKSSGTSNNAQSKLTFFHLVFVLEPPELELERQVDNVYRHVVTKLTAALNYEQRRCDYVRKEAEMILSLRENSGKNNIRLLSLINQIIREKYIFNIKMIRKLGSTLDEFMEEILKKSTLTKSIQQVYDSISADRIAHVLINDYIDLSLQVSPLAPTESDATGHGYDHYPIIAPYHTLLLLEDPEVILKNIPLDANPTLVQLIQILTPTKRYDL
ncbi:15699_t:CDS:1 [Acaulospora colombiana]|uniref:15699_t:CDS:1 n=1 Tax=Acaulospora colombiana TaxID=27376 RepID=A0ACA9KKZ8_9GLOM|nr:15699_t:CDS:1 [Acaulospora colombiana]